MCERDSGWLDIAGGWVGVCVWGEEGEQHWIKRAWFSGPCYEVGQKRTPEGILGTNLEYFEKCPSRGQWRH